MILHYSDQAQSVQTQVLKQTELAQDTLCLRIQASPELSRALPGQFFMLRDAQGTDPLIGRAFALYDCDPLAGWLEIAYLVKGKLTKRLSALKVGDTIGVCGPLGNSFADSPVEHLILVAGGIGQTPFLCLTKESLGTQQFGLRNSGYARRVSLCYGARSRRYLAGLDNFAAAGAQVYPATEDGSLGPPQLVTTTLENLLKLETDTNKVRIACCGPEAMMEAVAKIAACYSIRCQVSLETPMACGIGICFTCVAKVGTPADWDYRRTCVEGPIFDAQQIVWS